ncbi:MAG TPA: DinB family protein [Corynebacterium sp.]|nr:DinB family protein [Corynebacterium sp.]
MLLHETFQDLADRAEVNVKSFPSLTAEQINAHPGGHPNSIAWLLWHAGRVLDVLGSAAAGTGQLWETQDFRSRFQLGELGDGTGVGHSVEEAAQIRVGDLDLLIEYVAANLQAYRDYAATLEDDAVFEEVIGEFKGAPETRQARLTLIIVDALRHIDQALYIAGMPEL